MTEATFRTGLRNAIRGLWQPTITRAQFESTVRSLLSKELTNAWLEGAASCGIAEDELTGQEGRALLDFIKDQQGYLPDFAAYIVENNRKKDGKILDLFERGKLWLNRYGDARNRGMQMACSDQKLEWILGPTEQHCPDCSKYSGKVYRGSTWGNIRPQSSNLSCHGFRCLCRLEPTKKRANGGRPARMTG